MGSSKMPKLIVFDLDYTLWPFFVELEFLKPYRRKNENVVDFKDNVVKYYPEVPDVINKLCSVNVDLGLASRTSEIEGANQLVDLFGWNKYFKYIEIYPGSKVNHFNQFNEKSGYAYSDMLFFDDEERNITDVSAMEVTCQLVKGGMTMIELSRGLDLFQEKSKS